MTKEILCFGDSNTHGYNAEGGRFPYTARWTGILAGLLGADYHIIEEGLNGRTTVFEDPVRENASGLSMLQPLLLTHMPLDTLIIMLGTNDTKERFSASPALLGIAMQQLIKKAQATTEAWREGRQDIIVVAPAPIHAQIYQDSGSAMGAGCSEKSYRLAEEYRKAAELLHCRFLDAGSIAPVNTIDWMHLSREGHRALAQALAQML